MASKLKLALGGAALFFGSIYITLQIVGAGGPGAASAQPAGCLAVDAAASVQYQSRDAIPLPVVYVQYQCGRFEYRNEYYDLNGTKKLEGQLDPSEFQAANDVAEALAGDANVDLTADLRSAIEQVARERGIIPTRAQLDANDRAARQRW